MYTSLSFSVLIVTAISILKFIEKVCAKYFLRVLLMRMAATYGKAGGREGETNTYVILMPQLRSNILRKTFQPGYNLITVLMWPNLKTVHQFNR